MKTIEQALKKLQQVGCRRKVSMPSVDELSLAQIEKSLGVTLPTSYKIFLKNAQEFGLHYEEFLWPGTERDLVATNVDEHSCELPDFLVSFLSDGYGTQICFDTSEAIKGGEFPIVEWARGMLKSNLAEQELERVADNFPEWLIETLEYELEELKDA